MLEDAGRGLGELPDQPQGTVEVEQVVVGQLLAVPDRRRSPGSGPRRRRLHVERGLLVRVLAVSQRRAEREAKLERLGKRRGRIAASGARDGRLQVIGDRPGRRRPVRWNAASGQARGDRPASSRPVRGSRRSGPRTGRGSVTTATCAWFLAAARIERGAADVDVLDRLGERGIGPGDRRLERIEVHDDQVDRRESPGPRASPGRRGRRGGRGFPRGSWDGAS